MSEILLSNQALSPGVLQSWHGINTDELADINCHKPAIIAPNTPYLINHNSSSADRYLAPLSPLPVARNLTNLSLSYGGHNVAPIAELTNKLRDYNVGLLGTSTTVYANRMGGFVGAVKNYQFALMEYREALKSKSSFAVGKKQNAKMAFNKMQEQFQFELKVASSKIKTRHGMPLTHFDRATNIARSSRNVTKLQFTDQLQVNNMMKLAKYSKILGNGIAIIDFGSRVGNITNSYRARENWERDLFIESSSFALGTIAGSLTVNAGSAVLGFLVVATPIGWVGLIIGGAVVVGIAAGAAITTNSAIKNNSGSVYDEIMAWLKSV